MNEKERIRVLSVDDHEIMRSGIKYLLLAIDDIELVGEAGNGEEAIQLCETLHPDVILMDMRMPGLDGVQTTRRIRERYPHIRILALSSFEDEETIQRGTNETMCNPIFQAKLLNHEKSDFNIVLGLCVGHDSLFFQHAHAPTTVLAVKDRVTGHNPLAAIYLSDTYFRKIRHPELQSE